MTRPLWPGLSLLLIAAASTTFEWRARADEPIPGTIIPGCCGFDEMCCARQAERDNAKPPRPATPGEIDVAALPLATTTPANGDSGVIFYDDHGSPHAAPRPQGETRFVPPGRAGVIRIGDDSNFANFEQSGFFRGPPGRGSEFRHHGFGIAIDAAWSYPIVAPMFWQAIDVREDGKLSYRRFEGRFDRRTGAASEGRALASEMADVANGWIYAFRSHDADAGDSVHFVVPSGFLRSGSVTADPAGDSGLLHLVMPINPGSSGVASVGVFRQAIDGYTALGVLPKSDKTDMSLEISASRGKAESAPLVMVATHQH